LPWQAGPDVGIVQAVCALGERRREGVAWPSGIAAIRETGAGREWADWAGREGKLTWASQGSESACIVQREKGSQKQKGEGKEKRHCGKCEFAYVRHVGPLCGGRSAVGPGCERGSEAKDLVDQHGDGGKREGKTGGGG
jgi:hypothetical protein